MRFEIYEIEGYGVVLDFFYYEELADEFGDFLAESYPIEYPRRCEDPRFGFYFGPLACVEKVKKLVELFREKRKLQT